MPRYQYLFGGELPGLPCRVDRDSKHFRIACKIRISSKDCPLSTDCYGTEKNVHDGNYNSFPPALITSLGCPDTIFDHPRTRPPTTELPAWAIEQNQLLAPAYASS
jgi:hypothetical protein